jgi:hypothetical protein
MRVARDAKLRHTFEAEKQEVERRRNLTEEQRRQEDIASGKVF